MIRNLLIQGPSWDNTSEYSSLECEEIKNDLSVSINNIQKIEKLSKIIQERLNNLENLQYETIKKTIPI